MSDFNSQEVAPWCSSAALRRLPLHALLGEGATARVLSSAGIEGDQERPTLALKIAKEGMNEVLLREGRALSILGGTGTPQLLGVTTRDGSVALALSLVDGASLMSQSLPDAPDERHRWAQALLLQVGAVLERAHGCGFSHHDVKPENLLVHAEGAELRVTLIDWGLASDESFVRSGTPHFLPSAVLRGQDVAGSAADVHALAKTLAGLFDERFWSEPASPGWDRVPTAWRELLAPQLERDLPVSDATDFLRQARELELAPEPERDVSLLRSHYLAVVASSVEGEESSRRQGRTGRWLERFDAARVALTEAERIDDDVQGGGLRQSDPSGASRLGDSQGLGRPASGLKAHERARFVARVFGPAAADWELPEASDDALIDAVERIAQRKGLWGTTRYDLLDALAPEAAHGTLTGGAAPEREMTVVGCALHLGGGSADAAALRAVLQLEEAPEELKVEAARQARLARDFPLAERLLRGQSSAAACWERLQVRRRQGFVQDLDQELLEIEARGGEVAQQARALRARRELDSGRVESAWEIARGGEGESPGLLEVRALTEMTLGRDAEARRSIDRGTSLATSFEERARLVSVRGMLEHRSGEPEAALASFRQAAEFAQRAGAPLEEATFLVGVAASASDLAFPSLALDASERAERLFEALRIVQGLPRVLLTRASVLASLGLRAEVQALVARGRVLSRRTKDVRCEAYFELCSADILPRGPEQRQAATRARQLLADGTLDDRLQAAARWLAATGEVDPDADDWAAASEHFEAKLAWYCARATELCRGSGMNPQLSVGRGVLDQIRSLSQCGRRHATLGPTLASGAQLALLQGQPEVARELLALAERVADETLDRLRHEHVQAFRNLTWVEQARGTRIGDESAPQQLSDVEGLLRTLSHRGDFRYLLEQALDMLLLWTGVQRGLILMRAPGDRLVIRAARNVDRQNLGSDQRKLSQSMARRALSEGRPVVMVDAAADGSALHKSFVALRLRSVLAVPLVARGETHGVAYLDDQVRRGAFGQRELSWAQLIGTILALSICDERDRLLLRRVSRRAERAEARVRKQLADRERELDLARRQLSDLRGDDDLRGSYPHIVGRSEPMKRLLHLVDRVAQSEIPVLITGESGTGKELVARAVAREGSRKTGPFIAENCGAVPEGLLESTLFGHERGAFTGAHRRQEGLFRLADGGTLFLDEIGEMPLTMQTKLLRVLQDGSVRPLGSNRSEKVDVRLIVATHRDLVTMVKEGRFREDLFYRLNVVSLVVPPLRQRRDDIPQLVAHFLRHHAQKSGLNHERTLSDVALARLVQFDWPGNVRQLENEVRRMLVLGGERLTALDLSPEVLGDASHESEEPKTLREKVDALERRLVKEALDATSGNRTRAAELLGISRYGLQKMVARLKVDEPS